MPSATSDPADRWRAEAAASPSPNSPGLALESVEKTFRQGGRSLSVLRGAGLAIRPGELVALVGPSGAGKSTLLHIAGLLERADGGRILVEGRDCAKLNDGGRTAVRRSKLGFVYQFHHLLPEFTALENVAIPRMIGGEGKRAAKVRAGELLTAVGLAERFDHRPGRLSGGEQQRVAIARALANDPAVLLADEPTGNLDPTTAESVFDLVRTVVREHRLAALVATHNLDLARRMDRVLELRDGKVLPQG